MLKNRYYLTLVLFIVCISFISVSFFDYHANSTAVNDTTLINPQDRVLIIAPHPDDESIACAGVISYCTQKNIPVKVIILTDGYISAKPFKRYNETISAMELLGVKRENIHFLEYNDGTLPRLINWHWDNDTPYNLNGVYKKEDYAFSYHENMTYCGVELYNDLAEVITIYHPTVIFYPDSEDEQIDHWAGNAFTEYAMSKTNYNGSKYTYIIHNPPDWPSPRIYSPENDLSPPAELSDIGYRWVSFPINQYQERLKEAAFSHYPSQISNNSYIRSFIRTNELFAVNAENQVNISANNLPNNVLVIKEPIKDKKQDNIRTREIKSVNLSMDGDNVLLTITTKHNISMKTIYEVHVLFLENTNTGRIDLKIYNGTLYYQKQNKESYQDEPSQVEIAGNVMKMKIPAESLNKVNSFLICADIISGSSLVDWTAWRKVWINR